MSELKFIVDECLGSLLAQWLVQKGYDTISVIVEMKGSKDTDILNRALTENRILITSDKDFGDLVFHNKFQHAGIVLMRLQQRAPQNKIKVLENLLINCSGQLKNNFIVLSETSIRIIKQP